MTAASPAFDPALAAGIAIAAGIIGSIFAVLLVAPRLAWPDRLRPAPEPPRESADWSWAATLVLPFLIIVLQLVAFPLRWAGVPRSLWLAFGVSTGSGVLSVFLAWLLLCRRRGRPARALGWKLPDWRPHVLLLPLLAYPVALALMVLAVLFQIFVLHQPVPPPQAAVRALRAVTSPALRTLAVAAVAVVAPFAEETLFRGVLFRGLSFRWGFLPAMLVSAALFSAAHMDLEHALPIFMLGLLLAFLAREARSIVPGMFLHAMVNGGSILLAWKLPMPEGA